MISFACPTCSKGFRVPDDKAGKRTKCPQCEAAMVVPQADKKWWNEQSQQGQAQTQRPAESPPPKRHSKAAGLAVIAVLGVAVVLIVVAIAGRSGAKPDGSPSADNRTPLPKDPAAEARASFEKVFQAVQDGLPHLPPSKSAGINPGGSPGSDMLTGGEVEHDVLAKSKFDVTTTQSVVAPYRGVIQFGLKLKGKVQGTERGMRYSIPFDAKYTTAANYEYRDGKWRLEDVALTMTDFYADMGKPSEDLYSALIAAELNRKKPSVGQVTRLKGSTDAPLFRLLRGEK